MTLPSRPHARRACRRARGFSLIELMISLTIGLVIVIAAMSAYLGSSTASKVSEAQSRMNEDAQAALNILAQQIRMAGTNPVQADRAMDYRRNPVYTTTYVGGTATAYTTTLPTFVPATYTLATFSIRGCDGTFSNVTATAATDLSSLTCTGGTTTLPDSIAISYEADRYNTSGGAPTDCVGGTLASTSAGVFTHSGTPTTATFSVSDNRFYIGTSSGGTIPSLYCKGIQSGTQPLVENVEDLQFTYGTVSATSTAATATIAGYLTASDVSSATTMTPIAALGDRWGKVIAVRVCVVVRSEAPVLTDTASGSYYDCSGALISTTDRMLRKAYSTTVVLRNRRF